MEISVNNDVQTLGMGQRQQHTNSPFEKLGTMMKQVVEDDDDDYQGAAELQSALSESNNEYDITDDDDLGEDEDGEEYYRDLSDIAARFSTIKIATRLMVKYLITDEKMLVLKDKAVGDLANVQIVLDEDEETDEDVLTLNFESPFFVGNSEKSEGFLRQTLVNLMQFIHNCNARELIMVCDVSEAVEKVVTPLEESINRIIHSRFYSDTRVVTITPDEDDILDTLDTDEDDVEEDLENEDSSDEHEEGEIEAYYDVSDFLSHDTWYSFNVTETNDLVIDFTVCLNVHGLALYNAEPTIRKTEIGRLASFISKTVEANVYTHLGTAVCVAINTDMLKDEMTRTFVTEMFKDARYKYKTHVDVLDMVSIKEDYESAMNADALSLEAWDEEGDYLPSALSDVEVVLDSDEFMFMRVVTTMKDFQQAVKETA